MKFCLSEYLRYVMGALTLSGITYITDYAVCRSSDCWSVSSVGLFKKKTFGRPDNKRSGFRLQISALAVEIYQRTMIVADILSKTNCSMPLRVSSDRA